MNCAHGLGNGEARGLLILLLPRVVHQGHFDFVLTLGPAARRRCEGVSGRAAAIEIQSLFQSWDGTWFLTLDVFKGQRAFYLDLARGVGYDPDSVDRVIGCERAGLWTAALVLAEFEAAEICRSGTAGQDQH